MACSVIASLWIFLWCALLVFGLFAYLLFLRFCRSIAALQGREAEYHSNTGSDDVGTNDFVRAQLARVYRGEFDDINDGELVSLGWKVRRRLGIQFIAGIGLIAAGACIQAFGCF
jgi:hypothetical protein